VWEDIPEGAVRVLVYCREVNQGMGGDSGVEQDFALAWHLEWIDSSNNASYKKFNNYMTSEAAVRAVAKLEG
jgi:hypothetical protein